MTSIDINAALRAEEILAQELAEYPGHWVAIRDRRIVASANTLEELLENVDPGGLDRIVEVSRESVAGCLY
ncbi:MAG TPA: DUF5678 domain-containing protein [Solirubrobacterales bacterium]|nr:DUF5678 domain-containing protein [Solirubrobacterales bacterium]